MNFIEIMRYCPEEFYLYQDVDTGNIISHNPNVTGTL